MKRTTQFQWLLVLTVLLMVNKKTIVRAADGLPTANQDSLVFLETDGIVIIEAESVANLPTQWARDSTIAGFTGSSSLHYKGDDLFNVVGRHLLSYKLQINRVGQYRLRWRSRIAIGNSNTEHNDSWLRAPDADEFYAQVGQTRLYPKGSGRTPNPNGSGASGWFKAYQNNNGTWSLNTWTSDNDPHPIFVEFDSVGTYTIEIAGRSNGHSIDRIIAYHVSNSNESVALSPSTPESSRIVVQTGLAKTIRIRNLELFPNPVSGTVRIALPSSLIAGSYNLKLFNSAGQEIRSEQKSLVPGGTSTISAKGLAGGFYVIQFSDERQQYLGRFLRTNNE